MSQRIFQLLATVWCGSLWTIGYIVAPTLFAMLEDRHLAGTIAGRLFHAEAWIGLAAGCLLLVTATGLVRGGQTGYRLLRWLVLGMLLCVLVGYFGLQPFMASLREQAGALGVAVGDSPYRAQFGMLHGVSSVFYLVESLLGFVLIWKASGVRQPV
ncbi:MULTISPECIES: DUF4149 domain-containing protein [Ralstonia solanacearum species complex]|uniref:DUF4149 domain-containing protein n=1 Tax=Ralstonia syzygii TaxID=28097 RepID=A0ABX7ZFF9_9RALS|nr:MULTISPECIES: DUF4149 domain-containing protein [Ralstonia solanacearum species complex]BEU71831.1 DUF4149 domain-containing protein [Ralstonia pseudosolanacearum]AMP37350.1 hypothetical protein LBM2029_07265 [Ralstonia solanacearum]AXV76761.1 DUF4149 domain-containing protein [Ralstonia solanacearum]AXV86171.1 DUF4149 domain-containing protein [Ralstonia solanacearum]AXV90772.1 DUF4149 domain-containing protein [Ralstonia solanacearum]